MSSIFPALKPEQRAVLLTLMNTNPHTWKACIRRLWLHSDQVSGERDTLLYQLRSTHGHAWLGQTTAEHRAQLAEVAP